MLPVGFDKSTAEPDIAVYGEAASDPNFTDHGSVVRYIVPTNSAPGPLHIRVELWYQPIGFRWAHNLAPYKAPEPQRILSTTNPPPRVRLPSSPRRNRPDSYP